ncbi:Uncharacterised protein [Legionella steigerwaltii]|uniref:Uncharacterized protein n=1 Tax=Legionella steigerwaltii TaxID=460 RepID=A0A378L685_9GAMM|nr:hypothetical protein [Legionella steigerwaltii]KTD77384.1 hypothetical protein Lstg_1741 [Legionella steigerwaltii]STY22264.1 Uncharacterised protein [Legionella steigerwaltii]
MQSKYPAFFPSNTIKSFSGVQFSNVVKTSSAIESLYRGDDHLPAVIFLMPTLLTGVFCQSFPEVIDMEQIRLHKLTNLSNDFHMVSMSEDSQVALNWGSGSFITIDPILFSNYIVDVHATYHKNQLNFPARMEREKEHIALVVPFCSIKKITIHNKEFVNPFYLKISADNQEAIIAFDTLYGQLVSLLRKKYTQEVDEKEEKTALRAYTEAYLKFYTQFSGSDNPFNKSLSELFEHYPEFVENFLQANRITSKVDLLNELILSSSENLFEEHLYTKAIDTSYIYRTKVSTTCEEDDWAKPIYN